MLVHHFLEHGAQRHPQKTALIVGSSRYSYLDIDEMSNNIAHALIAQGIEKGDRVAIFLDNSVEAVASIFGILKAGGIFLMINPSTKTEKLTFLLNNCRAVAIISSWDKIAVVGQACNDTMSLSAAFFAGKETPSHGGLRKKCLSLVEILAGPNCHAPTSRTIDVDLATIIYTSGSTGNPKGVMMAHFNMVTAANSITTYLENTSDDIILNILPLSFDYGLYQVLMGFKMGATVVLEKAFIYPYKIVELLLKEKVTGFPIVPTISAILLQMDDIKKHSFDHLRYITNTAAALPPTHIQKLRQFFPKTKIYSMYGLTECKRVTYLPPDQIDIRPTSVGKGMPNEEVYIVDEVGARVGPNVIGELVVRGSNVMRGYWELPEETAKKLRPGPYPGEMVLHTGDLFKMDEEGYLYFVSRTDDIIKSRGEKVSPKEIEHILYEIDGVVEAAVIGIPDQVLGEAIMAFVVQKEGSSLTANDVFKFCAGHLEDFMVPKFVEFRKELPQTDTGKIKKIDLA